MLFGCDTFDPDVCDGDDAPATIVDHRQYCGPCREAYEKWVRDYEPPTPSFDDQLWAKVGRGW